jgi:glycosyltransferase involved in cell wall biosynthesis
LKDKENIVAFIDWYRPAFKAGGPIKSLENIVQSLDNTFYFYLVTSHYDVDNKPLNTEPNKWLKKGNYSIIYLDHEHQNSEFVLQSLKNITFKTIYFNSMFSSAFSVKPMSYLSSLNKKMVLAPRGMLGKGALRIKRVKKMAFLAFASRTTRYKKLTWHASSIQEEREIKKQFGPKANIEVALNLFNTPESKPHFTEKKPKELNLFFFSRIAKKKNLHFALRCLKELDHLENITFKIIGPIEEPNYWESCKGFIDEFKNIKVEHCEVNSSTKLPEIINNSHFFFFPTIHENFGHVIAESLALAKPIIISDQTPWNNLETNNVGFTLALSQKKEYVNTLLQCYKMAGVEYAAMQEKCLPYLMEFKNKYSSKEKYITLLKN